MVCAWPAARIRSRARSSDWLTWATSTSSTCWRRFRAWNWCCWSWVIRWYRAVAWRRRSRSLRLWRGNRLWYNVRRRVCTMIRLKADGLSLLALDGFMEPVEIYDATGMRLVGTFTPADPERV